VREVIGVVWAERPSGASGMASSNASLFIGGSP
jgi:hypothetical protein